MRTYDLHIRLKHQKNETEFTRLQNLATNLGFAGLAIDSPKPIAAEKLHKSLTIFHRLTFLPRSAARLRFHVNKQIKQADLLVIHGRSKPIWLAAAEIPAVHMVMLKDIEDFLVFDSQVARAMANQNKPVEVCLHKLLTQKGSIRSRLMRVMRTAMDHLVRANCLLILTSGACDPCELRAPKDLEALSYLASVPEDVAKNAMNQGPMNLLSQIQVSREPRSSAPSGRET